MGSRVAAALFFAALANGQQAGSKVCAPCHAEIARRYQATGMARSSGAAGLAGAPAGEFESGGVTYQVEGGVRLSFARAGTDVAGERRLAWFLGSGSVGRSFLFEREGFLFQSPVSFYASTGRWDISPGYRGAPRIILTRAVEPGCLTCHASGLQPLAGTQNGYRTPPFLEGGVACERCHGPGREHAARGGKGPIVNPAKLTGERRDSICAQCHLTGMVRVAKRRQKDDAYQPGALLSDYSAFFVRADAEEDRLKVASHFERFALSRCRRASGDKMWCGSCHDPHGEPLPEQRAAYYRARCESCHEDAACKADVNARQAAANDCTACHMPKSGVRDAEHAVYTDHSIPRRPRGGVSGAGVRELVSFWKNGAGERELGLAYAAMQDPRARGLLEKAVAQNPEDTVAAKQLAQIYDAAGDGERAMALYERVLKRDPSQVAAAVNLGTLYIRRNRTEEAMRLWRDALARNPGLTGTRVNLAVAQYRSGDAAAAAASLKKALEFDPDDAAARRLLGEIEGR